MCYTAHTGRTSHKLRGVAINLKEFLHALDAFNIPHEDEKKIRHHLRGHPRCDTRKKQYFNVIGSKKTAIERHDEGSIRCLTCVCVPVDDFPQEVFDLLQNGRKCEGEQNCLASGNNLVVHNIHTSILIEGKEGDAGAVMPEHCEMEGIMRSTA